MVADEMVIQRFTLTCFSNTFWKYMYVILILLSLDETIICSVLVQGGDILWVYFVKIAFTFK